MSIQDIITPITSLLAAIVGGSIAVFASYLQQRMARNDKKRTTIRENIEKSYGLTNQFAERCSSQKSIIESLVGKVVYLKAPAPFSGLNSLSLVNGSESSSLGYLETLIKLYFPSLRKEIEIYHSGITEMDNLYKKVNSNIEAEYIKYASGSYPYSMNEDNSIKSEGMFALDLKEELGEAIRINELVQKQARIIQSSLEQLVEQSLKD